MRFSATLSNTPLSFFPFHPGPFDSVISFPPSSIQSTDKCFKKSRLNCRTASVGSSLSSVTGLLQHGPCVLGSPRVSLRLLPTCNLHLQELKSLGCFIS